MVALFIEGFYCIFCTEQSQCCLEIQRLDDWKDDILE